jgi:hypothetical protein
VEEVTVMLLALVAQTFEAEVAKLLTLGNAFTVIFVVLPVVKLLLQLVAVNAIDVMVIVVVPALASATVLNVAVVADFVNVAVLPVDVFAPLRLYVTVYCVLVKLVEEMVTVDAVPAHTVVAPVVLKLVTTGPAFTVTTALPVLPAAEAVQLASLSVRIVYVVLVVGETATVIGLELPLNGIPPVMVPFHGPVPVTAMLRLALVPLQIVWVPVILPVGSGLTLKVAVLPLETVLVQLEAFLIAVIVTVVEPVFVSAVAGIVKLPVLAAIVSVAVLPVAVFAPVKL